MSPGASVRRFALLALLALASAGVPACSRDDAKPTPPPGPAESTPATPDKPVAPITPVTPVPPVAPVAPAAEVFRPFNGHDLTGWELAGNKKLNHWIAGKVDGEPDAGGFNVVEGEPRDLVQPAPVAINIYSQREFADCLIELEAMVPPGGNSGVYIMGEYELQLLDDPAADKDNPTDMDFGAIARLLKPKTYAKQGHGWQRIAIDFQAPRFNDAGVKTANAKLLRVTINDQLVHENAEIPEPTAGGLYSEDRPQGPLMLQGNEGPAAFRNIRITPR